MFELSLLCPEDRVDVLSDALDALDALSVSVEDADAETEHEQALFGEPGMPPPKEGWQRSRVTALFAEYSHEREYEDDIREVRSELNSLPGIGFELQGYTPGDSLDSASVGVSHQLTRDLSLRGGYSYNQSDEQSQQGVSVSLALDW